MSKAQIIEADYNEITQEMGDVPVIIFPFRLSTNRNHYIKEVVKYTVKQMESAKSLRIDLLFIRGIPESMGRTIANKVVQRLGSLDIPGSEDIHVHVQGGIDAEVLDQLERDFLVIRL